MVYNLSHTDDIGELLTYARYTVRKKIMSQIFVSFYIRSTKEPNRNANR